MSNIQNVSSKIKNLPTEIIGYILSFYNEDELWQKYQNEEFRIEMERPNMFINSNIRLSSQIAQSAIHHKFIVTMNFVELKNMLMNPLHSDLIKYCSNAYAIINERDTDVTHMEPTFEKHFKPVMERAKFIDVNSFYNDSFNITDYVPENVRMINPCYTFSSIDEANSALKHMQHDNNPFIKIITYGVTIRGSYKNLIVTGDMINITGSVENLKIINSASVTITGHIKNCRVVNSHHVDIINHVEELESCSSNVNLYDATKVTSYKSHVTSKGYIKEVYTESGGNFNIVLNAYVIDCTNVRFDNVSNLWIQDGMTYEYARYNYNNVKQLILIDTGDQDVTITNHPLLEKLYVCRIHNVKTVMCPKLKLVIATYGVNVSSDAPHKKVIHTINKIEDLQKY